MEKILRSLIGAVVLMSTAVFAGEPASELDPKVAVKLICQRTNLLPARVEVAFVVDGSTKNQDGFETKHVRRVAAIHPVVEGGVTVRRLVYYDLFWNDTLGWFMWEVRAERGGDAVYRWSERGGETVVK